MARRIVDVLVPVALNQVYSYRVPDGLGLDIGDLVRVPLGAREATGAVWGGSSARPGLDNRLKDIADKLDLPPLREELRRFIDWVSDYTLAPRGMVLRMCLRMGEELGPGRVHLGVRLAGPPPDRMTAARRRVLEVLVDGLLRGKSEAAEEAGVSPAVVDGLVDEGTLEVVELPPEQLAGEPIPDFRTPDFTPAQGEAALALRETVRQGGFSVTLLDGVTGSGKTESISRRSPQTIEDRPPGADPDARNRADRAVPRSLRRALRHARRPVAFAISRAERRRTWRAIADGERAGGGRRAFGIVPALSRSRPHRRRRRARVSPTSRKTACAITPATWRWCARARAASRSSWPRATPVARDRGNAPQRPLSPHRAARPVRRRRLPAIEPIDLRRESRRARTLARPRLAEGNEGAARARRAVAAVPQPARLCAADAVPPLRLPLPVPQLHRLAGGAPAFAGGSPATIAASPMPSPCPTCPECGTRTALSPAAPAWNALDEEAELLPAARVAGRCPSDLVARSSGCARSCVVAAGRAGRRRHRHPAGHQGLPLPEADAGRRRRCRPWP